MTLSEKEVAKYLSIARSLHPSFRFYDVHVHPYEVLFDRFLYKHNGKRGDVLSLNGDDYAPPAVSGIRLEGSPEGALVSRSPTPQDLSLAQFRQKISLMRLRNVYAHVGETVFDDQMGLGGIDACLLLPVPSVSDEFRGRLDWTGRVYRDRRRFRIAGSIPNTVGNADMGKFVAGMKEGFGIHALKIHPVITGIDLRTAAGKDRLTAMLDACRESRLPIVIHSGRNMSYWGVDRGNWASLEHLRDIDWSLSGQPVVIAHAGIHRCGVEEAGRELLPMLNRMMDRHGNLYADTSGIPYECLYRVLREVAHDRLLFGSDALYDAQWTAVVTLLHALQSSGRDAEDGFVRIASINPAGTVFREMPADDPSEDSLEAVRGGDPGERALRSGA